MTLKHVKRQEHPEDTRAKLVTLTTQGKNFARKLVPVIEQVDQSFFSNLSKTEQKVLQKSFLSLINS